MNGHQKCVSALVRLLVDINIKNKFGRTPLHEVEYLISKEIFILSLSVKISNQLL